MEKINLVSRNVISGRLCKFYEKWTTITSNTIILEWIKGYKIPLIQVPVQTNLPKTPSFSKAELLLLFEEINKLIIRGAIVKCEPLNDQFLSSFFLADKPNGQKRFILNLKNFNKHVNPPHFKLEDTRTVLRLIQKDCFLSSIDLKDAYFLVPMAAKHRKYLRFIFNDTLYEFTCLPFGLSSAPHAFTKILKPVIKELRLKGITCVNYLDDFLIFGDTMADCKHKTEITVRILESLGFIINQEKSVLTPSQTCKFLGFIFHTDSLQIELPVEKKNKIIDHIKYFQKEKSFKIRQFAKFIGILVSACPALKYGWLYTKAFEREKIQALKQNNMNYNAKMTNPFHSDLGWWLNNTNSKNDIKKDCFQLEIYTDSSLTGWGAHCNKEKTHGWWTLDEKKKHINFLELQAVYYGLKCFAKQLRNCSVLVRCDNTTAIACINRMGSVQYIHLHELSKKIWQWCEERNLWLFASYINTKDNWRADLESRVLQPETEWSLADYVFSVIQAELGPIEVDLFASKNNRKCTKYVSWLKDPDAYACDAFTLVWRNLKFYAFPPFALILRVLQKIIADKAEGVLVVPYWPGQVWYPLFKKLCCKEPLIFKPNPKLLTSPFSLDQHPLSASLSLVAARLSGDL